MIKKEIIRRFGVREDVSLGDYVVVVDGSYMLSTNSIDPIGHKSLAMSDGIFRVILTNQPCPMDIPLFHGTSIKGNNIIIRSLLNGEISFCNQFNLQKIDFNLSDMNHFNSDNINLSYIRSSNLDKILEGG